MHCGALHVGEFQPRHLGSALDVHEVCKANVCCSTVLICSLKCFNSLECKVLSISSVPLQHELELLDVLLAGKVDCTLGCSNDNAECEFSLQGHLGSTSEP